MCTCECPLGSKERRHETQFGIQSENHRTVSVDLGRHWGTYLRVDVALLLLENPVLTSLEEVTLQGNPKFHKNLLPPPSVASRPITAGEKIT